MIEMFIEFMDAIYYEGYTRHIAINHPEKYQFELDEFLTAHGLGLEVS